MTLARCVSLSKSRKSLSNACRRIFILVKTVVYHHSRALIRVAETGFCHSPPNTSYGLWRGVPLSTTVTSGVSLGQQAANGEYVVNCRSVGQGHSG